MLGVCVPMCTAVGDLFALVVAVGLVPMPPGVPQYMWCCWLYALCYFFPPVTVVGMAPLLRLQVSSGGLILL